jgi:hypothetical protein
MTGDECSSTNSSGVGGRVSPESCEKMHVLAVSVVCVEPGGSIMTGL